MSLYTDYLEQIEQRKQQDLHPKPIEDAALVDALVAQIIDTDNEHRADSLHFFIYNTLPGTTSAAGAKARFLKQIILGEHVVAELSPTFAFELLSHMKEGHPSRCSWTWLWAMMPRLQTLQPAFEDTGLPLRSGYRPTGSGTQ